MTRYDRCSLNSVHHTSDSNALLIAGNG